MKTMIFNLWRKFPRWRPKAPGYYLCSVKGGHTTPVKSLYYHSNGKWIDMSRQTVFDGYQVYKLGRVPIEENHVYTDRLCDLTEDVTYWKKQPKPR